MATLRDLYSHNGARFDTHLVLKSFMNYALYPCRILNKGSTLIIVEFKMRGRRRITFKVSTELVLETHTHSQDSFTVIPMALAGFAKAFSLPNSSKGLLLCYLKLLATTSSRHVPSLR